MKIKRRNSGQSTLEAETDPLDPRFSPNDGSGNVAYAWRLSGRLDTAAVKRCLNEIVARHEALRTVRQPSEKASVEAVEQELELRLEPGNVDIESGSFLVEEVRKPLDPGGPPLRATLIQSAPHEHILCLVTHQNILDDPSDEIVGRELATLYDAYTSGQPKLAELARQNADFVEPRRVWFETEDPSRHLDYWTRQLKGEWTPPRLPAADARQRTMTFETASESRTLPREWVPALTELARAENAMLFEVLLTAYQLLLFRYTGQPDIVVTSPVLVRPPEKESVIGPFTNLVLLRTDVDRNLSFRETLARVRQMCQDAWDHGETPTQRVIEALDRKEDWSPTLFAFRDSRGSTWQAGELKFEPLRPAHASSRTDLDTTVYVTPERFEFVAEYSTKRYDASVVATFLRHFGNLLEGIQRDADTRVGTLPILSPSDVALFDSWNATEAPYDDGCIHELVERQAKRSPASTAVEAIDASLTYAELDEQSNRVACHLQGLGVTRGEIVGLCVDRSAQMLAGLLGILKSGCAYLPLDPGFPTERVRFMIEDSGVRFLVTQESLGGGPPFTSLTRLCLDADAAALEEYHACRSEQRSDADDLAYVIYTSGSTGKPKGVQVLHRGVMNLIASMTRAPGLSERDTLLAVTTVSFDISVLELLGPLTVGAKVSVPPAEVVSDGPKLKAELDRTRATILQATPATWRMLVNSGWTGNEGLKALTGGEALQRDLASALVQRTDQVWNLYGPTETTVYSTGCRVEETSGVISIGCPIANTTVYILDSSLQRVPVGVTGDLYIGGAGVTKGYLGRPELTAERFIESPVDDGRGGIIYRTGDRARFLKDGSIEYLGREDNQVKVRGYRIELGEIEAILSSHDAVAESIAVVREFETGDRRIVAYYRPSPSDPHNDPADTELRAHLGEMLPSYMVPSALVRMDEFPLTPNGKVDRGRLPAPDPTRPSLEGRYEAASTELERALAEIWCEVLDRTDIGVEDDFFELGGDSLQAARIVNRVQQSLDEPLFVASLFEASSVREFAAFLEREYPDSFPETATPEGDSEPITEDAIRSMEEIIPRVTLRAVRGATERKNKPAIFVLAPPRSGTTLLRVMLAGHSRMFAAAELQLLGFETLRERRDAYTGKFAAWLDGTVRAIMEIKLCDAEAAQEVMETFETEDYTTREFYGVLQDWLGERTLVDKSPSYALDPAALEKAERDFDGPQYIHLTRHPYAMVRSFEEHHLEQVLYVRDHDFTSRQLAELVWLVSHRNIVNFLNQLPRTRWHRLAFEDLVTDPRTSIERLCRDLSIEFEPGLLAPYSDTQRKMTDGIHAESIPMGDTKFLQHGRIDPSVAERSKNARGEELGAPTLELARSLGY